MQLSAQVSGVSNDLPYVQLNACIDKLGRLMQQKKHEKKDEKQEMASSAQSVTEVKADADFASLEAEIKKILDNLIETQQQILSLAPVNPSSSPQIQANVKKYLELARQNDPQFSVNCLDWTGKSPLIRAAKYEMHWLVDVLLKMGADVDLVDKGQTTALGYYLLRGDWQKAEMLLEKSKNPYLPAKNQNYSEDTLTDFLACPLHLIFRDETGKPKDQAKIIEFLTKVFAKQPPNKQLLCFMLLDVVDLQMRDVLKFLGKEHKLDAIEDVFYTAEYSREFMGRRDLITHAVKKGDIEIAKSVCAMIWRRRDRGVFDYADRSVEPPVQNAALAYAIEAESLEMVKSLVWYGATVAPKLWEAAWQKKNINLLIALLGNVDPKEKNKNSAQATRILKLMFDRGVVDPPEHVKLLIEHGATLEDNYLNKILTDPKFDARFVGLYSRYADKQIWTENHRWTRPLPLAVQQSLDKLRAMLEVKGVNLECTDSEGRTALRVAVESANKEAVELLLAAGANPQEQLALMFIAVNKFKSEEKSTKTVREEIVRLLVSKGSVLNKETMTLFVEAFKKDPAKLLAYLNWFTNPQGVWSEGEVKTELKSERGTKLNSNKVFDVGIMVQILSDALSKNWDKVVNFILLNCDLALTNIFSRDWNDLFQMHALFTDEQFNIFVGYVRDTKILLDLKIRDVAPEKQKSIRERLEFLKKCEAKVHPPVLSSQQGQQLQPAAPLPVAGYGLGLANGVSPAAQNRL